MQSKIIKVFAISTISFLLFTCTDEPDFPVNNVQGYKPVYESASIGSITFGTVRPIVKPGKILRYANYLLINEVNDGIHFYDNSNPSLPIPVGFLAIENNVDMVVKNNVLYVDYLNNVVALNFENLNNVKELSRTSIWSLVVPPEGDTYFECIDPAKGAVTGWIRVTLSNPKCYR